MGAVHNTKRRLPGSFCRPDAFADGFGRDLEQGIYREAAEVELCGLCTDICVISNAMLVKTFMPETLVTVDGSCCAGVTPASHRNALEAMKMCQVNVI